MVIIKVLIFNQRKLEHELETIKRCTSVKRSIISS